MDAFGDGKQLTNSILSRLVNQVVCDLAQLSVISMGYASHRPHCLETLGRRAPRLFRGLKEVALLELCIGLPEEPARGLSVLLR